MTDVELMNAPVLAPVEPETLPFETLDGPTDPAEVLTLVEALLLASPGPSTLNDIARGAGLSPEVVSEALAQLTTEEGRGWFIQWHGETVQLATAPRFARYVRRFLGLEREARLSTAALETVAVIAYQQPVTRGDIEAIRGVDCSGVLATLLSRGLVEQVGRAETPGQPYTYGTTPVFLRHFGMRSLDELPPLGQSEGEDLIDKMSGMIEEARLSEEALAGLD